MHAAGDIYGYRAATALTRLPALQSRRCVTLLTGLRASFARRRRNPWAQDACDQLDEAFSRACWKTTPA